MDIASLEELQDNQLVHSIDLLEEKLEGVQEILKTYREKVTHLRQENIRLKTEFKSLEEDLSEKDSYLKLLKQAHNSRKNVIYEYESTLHSELIRTKQFQLNSRKELDAYEQYEEISCKIRLRTIGDFS